MQEVLEQVQDDGRNSDCLSAFPIKAGPDRRYVCGSIFCGR